MKVLVLTQQYPSDNDLYKNMFVHNRIKKYMSESSDIDFNVFVLNGKKRDYTYDSVNVNSGNERELSQIIVKNDFDRIVIHFLTFRMVPVLLKYAQDIKKIVWVHGYEAISWRRRVFNNTSPLFLKYVFGNKIQIHFFKKFVNKCRNTTFVFVSNWMKNVSEEDLNVKFKNFEIIPNGVDTSFYTKERDKSGLRRNILSIRPFGSRKYATDVIAKSILQFSKQKDFYKYNFTIIGKGKYFDKDTSDIKKFDNVKLINGFLNADEIKSFHNKNGIFLCPTRQDAQGVSMCEAMSSGLVPITSNNTAIPEFVNDKDSGFLTERTDDIIKGIECVGEDEILFEKMSNAARSSIEEKCNLNDIANLELKVIRK